MQDTLWCDIAINSYCGSIQVMCSASWLWRQGTTIWIHDTLYCRILYTHHLNTLSVTWQLWTLKFVVLYCNSILRAAFLLLGVINGTAPNPVRLSELCERLGRIVGRPSWLPVPEFALKAVLGEGASVVTLIFVVVHSAHVTNRQ